MEITRPFLLLLLLLLPVLYYGYRRSLVDLSRTQRIISLCIRTIIILLLILGVSDLQYLKTDEKLTVMFLTDISDSISEEGLTKSTEFLNEALSSQDGNQEVGIIAFTDKAEILKSPENDQETIVSGELKLVDTKQKWLDADEEAGDTTNIAQAIETAWSVFPSNANKRIVLISDGIETKGDAVHTGLRGKDFGIQIDTVPIYPSDEPEVMVQRIDAPAQVKQGAPFNLEVIIHSNHEDLAEVRLSKNKFEAAKKEVRLVEGENRVVFTETSEESGTLTYDVICRATQDTRYDNNRAFGIVSVSGKPKILLIDENESQTRYLSRVLEDAKIRVDVRNGLGVPNELADLQNYELVMFSDVPANRLNDKQMELIRTYIQDLGGGFMMLGSENSFGLGGYYKTPIEEVLPVRTDTEKKKENPSLAMVLVIDKSGSMGGIKIELAKEAARSTVELLGPRDKIGVIAFDGSPFWITEMHDASDKAFISNQVGTITASGGTNLYPALQQAYFALTETTAKLKHVIVLSDGHSQSGDWYGIANSMHSERITISTVGIGSGADMNMLGDLAKWGGGREYFTQDPYNVPQIFAKETVTASKSAIIDQPFIPQRIKPTQVLSGIDLDLAPFLLGYVATQPRPTAEIFLVSDRGDPVMASWQYGLGKVVAFTSDAKARWASDWLEWPGYGKFWTQLVRDTMRKTTLSNFQAEITKDKGVAHLAIDALNENGEFLNELDSDISLIGPDLKKKDLSISQTAPGKYELEFPTKEIGPYFLNIMQKQAGDIVNTQVTGTVVSYPEEYLVSNANEPLLSQLSSVSDGKFNISAADAFRPPENPVVLRIHLWRPFLIAALILLLIDIALRRIDMRRS
ncbi:VWA domain-containing protein [Candidatus Poribacteria bacterium]|nr:VWA domain-containing protein [Candidatus Poribacteria bacterium]MYI94597.1 VWA domain-containing protein [Candidatus Poribacteria bacterium]